MREEGVTIKIRRNAECAAKKEAIFTVKNQNGRKPILSDRK